MKVLVSLKQKHEQLLINMILFFSQKLMFAIKLLIILHYLAQYF